MKKIIDPFTCLLPTIDLHGLNSFEAEVKIKEFLNDSIRLCNYKICVIHGKGKGILKDTLYDILKKDKRVLSYRQDNINDGMSIIELDKLN